MLTSYNTPQVWDASCTIRVALPVAGLKVLVAANFECRKLFPTFSYIKAYKICLIVKKVGLHIVFITWKKEKSNTR